MMIFLLFVVVGIVILANRGSSAFGGSAHASPESPEEILKRRYARGEIDKAAFEERRKDIRAS